MERGALPPHKQEAFQQSQIALLRAPTLNKPDFNKRLHLLSDANKGTQEITGMIAWALVQAANNEGEWLSIFLNVVC